MGFETPEEAERYAESMEFNAERRRDEAMFKHALEYVPPEVALKERIEVLTATLMGVRGMAALEALNGSTAWARSVKLIDEVLK